MNRFAIPNNLPPCPPVYDAFKHRFSGWQLGMGLPDTLAALLRGLFMLGEEDAICKNTAHGMALWGMQAYPLSGPMAQWGAKAFNQGLVASPALAKLMVHAANRPGFTEQDDENLATWHALARQEDLGLTLRFLKVVLGNVQTGMTWLEYVWQDLIHMGRPEILQAALDMTAWTEVTQPLRQRLDADRAFHCLPPEEALAVVEELDPDAWGLWRAYAGSELLLRMGKSNEAKATLAQLWKIIPWHVNISLKLYDLFHPAPIADVSDTGDVAILAYSWNKADLLKGTLESLLASDIGSAKVYALNNGSTDHTAQVLLDAQRRFGKERFHIESLPVNVGAPAARNWLLSLPEVKAATWAAFLDDDIVLPENWLLRLLGAAKGHDDLGAVGCRITAATPPFGLQSADYNLFPTPPTDPEPGMIPNRVLVFDNCAGSVDDGLFTYTRPCMSVSGCCHMVRTASIETTGGFDLGFTPSQFDDLDRDIRANLEGTPALYVGGLAIRHIQHSSLAKSKTPRQMGAVMGNKLKLDTKYTDEELISLGQKNRAMLWDDLEMKCRFLVDRLGISA